MELIRRITPWEAVKDGKGFPEKKLPKSRGQRSDAHEPFLQAWQPFKSFL